MTGMISLTSWVLIFSAVSASAIAQLMLKIGMDLSREKHDTSLGLLFIFRSLFEPSVLVGLFIYAISVLAWLWVLSKVDLSIAYPFVGISFILTLFFGIFFLGEVASINKVVGTLLICLGCYLVSRAA